MKSYISNNNVKSDFIYTREYFINWGKKVAEESLEILRNDLKSPDDD